MKLKLKHLRQEDIDKIRFRVLSSILVSYVKKRDPCPPVQHLRFMRPTHKAYILRDGNPPADQDRHPWERGLRLEIDLGYIKPATALAVMRAIHERRMSGDQEPNWHLVRILTRDILAQSSIRMPLPDASELAKPQIQEDKLREEAPLVREEMRERIARDGRLWKH